MVNHSLMPYPIQIQNKWYSFLSGSKHWGQIWMKLSGGVRNGSRKNLFDFGDDQITVWILVVCLFLNDYRNFQTIKHT